MTLSVTIDEWDISRIRVGQAAVITVDALCVPAAALGEENGQAVLYTSIHPETGEPCNPVAVTIGIADAAYVQILDGISQGDVVYYRCYDAPSETNAPSF